MVDSIILETARYYVVDDLAGAVQPSARLQSLLERLRLAKPISPLGLVFLQEQGLISLHKLITGHVTYEVFAAEASAEKSARADRAATSRAANEAAAAAREKESREAYALQRAKAQAERIARESDPRYVAKMRNRQLRSQYAIDGYVDEEHLGSLMGILRKADSGDRLSKQELAWLHSVEDGSYFTQELKLAYHRAEAIALAAEFKATGDPWSAINASSHYRKSNQSDTAELMLSSIRLEALAGSKVKSAFCTTRGGVMRDKGNLLEAKTLAEMGHSLMPGDFRPCTLLGAVCTEMGALQSGREWFEKAIERGASPDSGDQELRRIYFRADMALKEDLKKFLLAQDHVRYAWVLQRGTRA